MGERYLVDAHPCRDCGEPVLVRCRRAIPEACCSQCSERRRLISRGNLVDRLAAQDFAKVNRRVEKTVPLLLGVLAAAHRRLDAAGDWLRAAQTATPRERRRLLRLARNRAWWAHALLGHCPKLFTDAGEELFEGSPVRVVEGGGKRTALALTTLRLVDR